MNSMKQGTWIAATVLLGACATAACGGSAANSSPAAVAPSPGPDDETAGLMEHHRYHHHGGVTLLIAMSLDTLGISPEQRPAVEKLRADLHARMEPARSAERGLVTTLADGLSAGNIDEGKVDLGLADVGTAAASAEGASVDALNELHGILTPVQRAALVDKVEAHWAVWQTANGGGPSVAEGPAEASAGYLAMLGADLDLTADQMNRIRAGIGSDARRLPMFDPQEMTAQLRAFGDAFRSETFDARGSALANTASTRMISWGAGRMARFVEAVSPVLTTDQRVSFALRLREHANHDPSVEATQ
jgi:Spy/CpxP family protein refolding chaperone